MNRYTVEREGVGLYARYTVRDADGVRWATFNTRRDALQHAKERTARRAALGESSPAPLPQEKANG